ncbi:MAG: hypothetical protein M3525_08900 [Acidobacteriota bacterium]|jgi:metal-responsive CopG/Arc/MetJ family transcriptional regulator|nr:hypothetical protein [Acidobacteriota bacterium]
MKVETCVIISEDLLKELDDAANGECSRSEFVEKALRKYLDDLKLWRRVGENAEKEKEILNRMAVEQREEIEENLRFVAELNLRIVK